MPVLGILLDEFSQSNCWVDKVHNYGFDKYGLTALQKGWANLFSFYEFLGALPAFPTIKLFPHDYIQSWVASPRTDGMGVEMGAPALLPTRGHPRAP